MTRSSTPTKPEPFWHRLSAIMLYPARGAAIVTLIVLTIGRMLGFLPAVGWLITILVWLAAYKYAFEVLRNTADGRMDPPETVLGVDNGVVWRFLGLLILAAIAAGVVGALFGEGALMVAIGLVVLLLPGAIISLAIDGSFLRALNPGVAWAIATRVGWPYLAVVGVLYAIQVSESNAQTWLKDALPPMVSTVAMTFVEMWAMFATFHLLGYLVYQYHEDLGYSPEGLHQYGPPPLEQQDRALLEQAETFVRDGKPNEAIALLRAETRTRAISLDAHELYHRLLRQNGNKEAVSEHAGLYLNLMMMDKQDRRALALLRSTLDADPDFVPMQIEDAEKLVERARFSAQSQLQLDLLLAMLRKHPRRQAAPRWGLEAALLLVDRFGRDDEARDILERVRERCEDEEMRAKIDAALKPLRPLTA